jgi:hypothetical protein
MDNHLNQSDEKIFKNPVITPLSVEYLSDTAPWMKFISILGFVISGLMAVMSFVFLATPTMIGLNFFVFIIYLVAAIVMFFPNLYLYNYASRIDEYCVSNNVDDIETAFEMQKKYWKYVGICAIIYIGFILIGLLFAVSGALLR